MNGIGASPPQAGEGPFPSPYPLPGGWIGQELAASRLTRREGDPVSNGIGIGNGNGHGNEFRREGDGLEFLWDLFHRIYDVEGIVRVGGVGLLVVIVFVETGLMVGFFLPGDSLLVTAGLFAARGDLSMWSLNLLLSVAAIAGDTVGYAIGYRAGPRLFTREDSFWFNKKHLITTREFYDRHGGFTIVIARFLPILRTFAPVVAGVGAMRYVRFLSFNVFGGVGWVLSLTSAGYLLGRIVPNIDQHIHVVVAVVIALSLLPGAIKLVRERLRARAPAASD